MHRYDFVSWASPVNAAFIMQPLMILRAGCGIQGHQTGRQSVALPSASATGERQLATTAFSIPLRIDATFHCGFDSAQRVAAGWKSKMTTYALDRVRR
jgi:hypothetical protein